MTTLTSNDHPSTLATRTVSLRIVQPGADDRLVPLPAGKCTIGSSDRCQVHLTDAQVRPLHCLIVHEANETLVTRWAPGALLNDQDFATAPFQAGDCLQIGDVQLLLVVDESDSSEPHDQPQPQPPAVSAVSNAFAMPAPVMPAPVVKAPAFEPEAVPSTSVADTQKIEQRADRLKRANEGARKRCRKLVGSLRTMRSEATSFDQRIDDLQRQLTAALEEREQIFTQLSQLQGEAGERESQSSAEIDRLISELTAAYEKACVAEASVAEQSEHSEQIQTELASLQGQREQWEQIRSAGELQRTKLSEALADRERAIDTMKAEIEQTRALASQAEASQAEQATALETLQTELEQVQTEREQLAAAQAESRQRQLDAEQSQADSEQNLAVFQLELEKFQITSRQTEQELRESNSTLENLQAEFAPLSEEREQLTSMRTEYQLREQGWEHELASRDVQIEQLTDEIKQLRTAVDEANQGAATQVSQVEGFQQQLATLTSERDLLLTSQADQVQKAQEWEEHVAARDRRIKELEEEHVGICEMLQSVEKGAFEQVDSCNKLEQQLASIRAERDQLAGALPEQQEYIKQLEQALPERDGQISLLSDELTKTSQRQMELETQLAESATANRALEAELTDRNTRCEQLVTEQDTNQQSHAEVEQTLTQYQGLIEELQEQIEAAQQHRQELEQTVAQGTQANEAYQAELNQLQSHYEQLTTDHQAETERRHDLDQQLAERDQNVELFQVDLQSMRGELDRTVEQVSSLQTERETLNQQLTGLRDELEAHETASQVSESEEASVSPELLAQFEEEKTLLQQRIDQKDQQAVQLAADLEQAHQCLQVAEQALLAQADTPVAEPIETEEPVSEEPNSEEPISEEPVVWPSEPNAKSSDDAAEVESDSETAQEFTQERAHETAQETAPESADFHDAYAAEETYETADAYGAEAEEFASREPAESEQSAEAMPTDQVNEFFDGASGELVSGQPVAGEPDSGEPDSEELEISAASAPTESTSTAFDKPEPDPVTEEPKEEFQPTSFIDQYQHILDESEEVIAEPVSPVPPETEPALTENKLGAEIDAMKTGGEDDSDEALEAYMSNMLRRMRGDENDDASLPPQASSSTTLNQNPNPVAAVDEVLDQVAPERETAEESQESEPFDLEQMKRSSRKPALPTDLSAMRELANSSARRAISKHHKRLHLEKSFGLFLGCLLAIGLGVFMLLRATAAQEFLGLNFLGGSVAVLVGVIVGFKLLGQLLGAIREGSQEKKSARGSVG